THQFHIKATANSVMVTVPPWHSLKITDTHSLNDWTIAWTQGAGLFIPIARKPSQQTQAIFWTNRSSQTRYVEVTRPKGNHQTPAVFVGRVNPSLLRDFSQDDLGLPTIAVWDWVHSQVVFPSQLRAGVALSFDASKNQNRVLRIRLPLEQTDEWLRRQVCFELMVDNQPATFHCLSPRMQTTRHPWIKPSAYWTQPLWIPLNAFDAKKNLAIVFSQHVWIESFSKKSTDFLFPELNDQLTLMKEGWTAWFEQQQNQHAMTKFASVYPRKALNNNYLLSIKPYRPLAFFPLNTPRQLATYHLTEAQQTKRLDARQFAAFSSLNADQPLYYHLPANRYRLLVLPDKQTARILVTYGSGKTQLIHWKPQQTLPLREKPSLIEAITGNKEDHMTVHAIDLFLPDGEDRFHLSVDHGVHQVAVQQIKKRENTESFQDYQRLLVKLNRPKNFFYLLLKHQANPPLTSLSEKALYHHWQPLLMLLDQAADHFKGRVLPFERQRQTLPAGEYGKQFNRLKALESKAPYQALAGYVALMNNENQTSHLLTQQAIVGLFERLGLFNLSKDFQKSLVLSNAFQASWQPIAMRLSRQLAREKKWYQQVGLWASLCQKQCNDARLLAMATALNQMGYTQLSHQLMALLAQPPLPQVVDKTPRSYELFAKSNEWFWFVDRGNHSKDPVQRMLLAPKKPVRFHIKGKGVLAVRYYMPQSHFEKWQNSYDLLSIKREKSQRWQVMTPSRLASSWYNEKLGHLLRSRTFYIPLNNESNTIRLEPQSAHWLMDYAIVNDPFDSMQHIPYPIAQDAKTSRIDEQLTKALVNRVLSNKLDGSTVVGAFDRSELDATTAPLYALLAQSMEWNPMNSIIQQAGVMSEYDATKHLALSPLSRARDAMIKKTGRYLSAKQPVDLILNASDSAEFRLVFQPRTFSFYQWRPANVLIDQGQGWQEVAITDQALVVYPLGTVLDRKKITLKLTHAESMQWVSVTLQQRVLNQWQAVENNTPQQWHIATRKTPVKARIKGPMQIAIQTSHSTEFNQLSSGWHTLELPHLSNGSEQKTGYRLFQLEEHSKNNRTKQAVIQSTPRNIRPSLLSEQPISPPVDFSHPVVSSPWHIGWSSAYIKRQDVHVGESRIAEQFVETRGGFQNKTDTLGHYRMRALWRSAHSKGNDVVGLKGDWFLPRWVAGINQQARLAAYYQKLSEPLTDMTEYDWSTSLYLEWQVKHAIAFGQFVKRTFTITPFYRDQGLKDLPLALQDQVDRDIYSDYANDHPYGLTLNESWRWQPWLDTKISGSIGLMTNPDANVFMPDRIEAAILWQQLLGEWVLSSDVRIRGYQQDADRLHQTTRWRFAVKADWLRLNQSHTNWHLAFGFALNNSLSQPSGFVRLSRAFGPGEKTYFPGEISFDDRR
ncbi:MAG: hypothetical protein OXE99_14775, partial [Cellvibrionales bacterium]|nr:hypothetical protein [Cellvibrionales bacterium]